MSLWILPDPLGPAGSARPKQLLQGSRFGARRGNFSPDGKWIAYVSNESGRSEVYAMPFPGAGAKVQISTDGGLIPKWRPDGREIFFAGPDGRLRAAAVHVSGGTLEVDEPRVLPISVTVINDSQYEVSADGQRFLMVSQPDYTKAEPLTLMQNWTAGLKK